MASIRLQPSAQPGSWPKRQTRGVWRLSRASNTGTASRATRPRSPWPASTRKSNITAVAGTCMTLRSVPWPAARAARGRIRKSAPHHAEGRVSEQHSSGNTRSAFRTGRCPHVHCERSAYPMGMGGSRRELVDAESPPVGRYPRQTKGSQRFGVRQLLACFNDQAAELPKFLRGEP